MQICRDQESWPSGETSYRRRAETDASAPFLFCHVIGRNLPCHSECMNSNDRGRNLRSCRFISYICRQGCDVKQLILILEKAVAQENCLGWLLSWPATVSILQPCTLRHEVGVKRPLCCRYNDHPTHEPKLLALERLRSPIVTTPRHGIDGLKDERKCDSWNGTRREMILHINIHKIPRKATRHPAPMQ